MEVTQISGVNSLIHGILGIKLVVRQTPLSTEPFHQSLSVVLTGLELFVDHSGLELSEICLSLPP